MKHAFSLVELSIVLIKRAVSFSGLTRESRQHDNKILASSARMTTSHHRDEGRGMRDESFYTRLSPLASHPSQGFNLVELTSLSLANVMSLGKLSYRRRPVSTATLSWTPACAGVTSGFSLVELSIVLVILGLLTGGILTGQNLIRAAELRSVTTEFAAFQAAVNTFRDKYFALPGDMTNAEDFWGTMTNCGAASPSGTGTQTCNGDGDGTIDDAAAASQTGENFTFWQHLANAGLIEGSYTGIAGPGSVIDVEFGQNTPRAKVSNSGWAVGTLGIFPGNADMYATDYGSYFTFGTETTSGSNGNPTITPEEAWNIDTKVDDGRPGYGKVIARPWGTNVADNKCSINAADETDLESDYNLTYDSIACVLYFTRIF